MLRSLRTLRSIPRIKDIALILGKHGFHQVSDVLQAPVRTRLRKFLKREPRETVQQPERLRMALEELGPTFIKFGQMLSTRPDLVPPAYVAELSQLQDNVAAEPFAAVEKTLAEAFGGKVDEFFAEIDSKALATASIAQVHLARTRDGESVVVKVRRRGIEKLIREDLWVLRLLAEFLSGWRDLSFIDAEGIVRQFERAITQELHFDFECRHLVRAREQLPSDSVVYVPRVDVERSRDSVLTVEYLEGRRLSSLRSSPLDPVRGAEIGTAIALTLLKQVFEHGFYHGDPHPGNFILMSDGRVGLIDFGHVGLCTPQMTDDMLTLIIALVRRNYDAVARWALKQGKLQHEIDVRTLAAELMETLDPLYGTELAEIHVDELFNSLFEIVVRNGISLPTQYVQVGRTLVLLESVLRLCAPHLEVVSAVRPYALDMFRRRWSPDRVLRDLRGETAEILSAARSYPANLAEILRRGAEGKLELQMNLREMDRVERRLEQISLRVPVALMICGLAISSAILLAGSDLKTDRLPVVMGLLGFALAGVLIARLFLRS